MSPPANPQIYVSDQCFATANAITPALVMSSWFLWLGIIGYALCRSAWLLAHAAEQTSAVNPKTHKQ